jgi:16S rRNA pseudouridine516 synthase
MRIDKFLADNLCISREQAKEMIKRRDVYLRGSAVLRFDEKLNEGDSVTVNGRELVFSKHIYLLLNKPAGLVCENRKNIDGTVFSCIPENLRRKNLSVCGRLDKDTEGLLVITDDGDFVHKIISPKNHIEKTYFARLHAPANADYSEKLAEGLTIDHGEICKPAKIELTEKPNEVYITISEGKYHQIKRMFLSLGNEVIFLSRVKCGGLSLPENLPIGRVRVLTSTDCDELCKMQ